MLVMVAVFLLAACEAVQEPKEEAKKEPPSTEEEAVEVVSEKEEEIIKSISQFMILQNAPESDAGFVDGQIQLEAVALNGSSVKKRDGVLWRSTDERIVQVDGQGTATITGSEGTARIIAEYGTGRDFVTVKVNDAGSPSLEKEEDEMYSLTEKILADLTIEEKVGQMVIADFRQAGSEAITAVTPDIERQMRKYHIGGVILFQENVSGMEPTVKLAEQFQSLSQKLGLFISIDQEGGTVTRIKSGTNLPGNMALGATGSAELAEKAGAVTGKELLALGFNMNFAPSLDVNGNPDNPVIGVRSFGGTPELVADMGNGYVNGLQSTGVISVAKHFPGHGDTIADSHAGLPVVEHSAEHLYETEIFPFEEAMKEGVDAIMMSHVAYPVLDPSVIVSGKSGQKIPLPASLSKTITTTITREEMGYQGVIITDALGMGAIDQHFEPAEAAVKAIQAGADIILMPKNLEQVMPAVLSAVKNGEITQEQVDQSARRIISLKLKRGILKEENPAPLEGRMVAANQTVGSEDHKELEKRVAEQSVTLVKNKKVLPLTRLKEDKKIVVIGHKHIDELTDALKEYHADIELVELGENYELTTSAQALIEEADYIIAGTYSSDVDMRSPDHPQIKMMKQLMGVAKSPVIAVAIQNPYDLMAYSEVDAYLAQYGYQPASFRAVASIIFGESEPAGKLPVSIPDGNGGILYSAGHGLDY